MGHPLSGGEDHRTEGLCPVSGLAAVSCELVSGCRDTSHSPDFGASRTVPICPRSIWCSPPRPPLPHYCLSTLRPPFAILHPFVPFTILMALISLDNMQFYEPSSQTAKPGRSARKMPPLSSVAASSVTVAVSTGVQEEQSTEARLHNKKAPTIRTEVNSLRTEMVDPEILDEPTVGAEGAECAQDDEDMNGKVMLSTLYFETLHVQDLGSRSTTSSRRHALMLPTTTVSIWSKTCFS